MNMNSRNQRTREGLSSAELVVAMAIAMSALVVITQLMGTVARQSQERARHATAVREAGNIMEELMSQSWDTLDIAKPPSVSLSSSCSESLPEARLGVEIADEEGLAGFRRIAVQIDWAVAGGQRCAPVRLVAWKARLEKEAN